MPSTRLALAPEQRAELWFSKIERDVIARGGVSRRRRDLRRDPRALRAQSQCRGHLHMKHQGFSAPAPGHLRPREESRSPMSAPDAGTARRVIEFFTANIRNPHTRNHGRPRVGGVEQVAGLAPGGELPRSRDHRADDLRVCARGRRPEDARRGRIRAGAQDVGAPTGLYDRRNDEVERILI